MLKAKLFSLQIVKIRSARGTCTGPKTKRQVLRAGLRKELGLRKVIYR